MSQEEVFNLVYEKYKEVFPEMMHSSGGLPDTKGPGTSDVDISLYCKDHKSLAIYFPEDTDVDASKPERTVYTLKGYAREVNIYCSDAMWWNQAVLHRNTELALKEQYPNLYSEAYAIKKDEGISTEAAWAKVLNLDDNYYEILLDSEKSLQIAKEVYSTKV